MLSMVIRDVLSEEAIRTSDPNPRVGCLIFDADGKELGRGHTQRVGQAHAEVMALRQAMDAGHDVRGSTVHVTLEPCSHHGRTPPCCDALINAGVARVVVAQQDPNPKVAGQGIARLRAAGIDVIVLAPDDADAVAARDINIGFFSRMIRHTPWVRMKIAASLDGTTALHNGQSQWITGKAARADGHAWRARASAVLTGIGTVLEDDPRLDVREVNTPRQPHLVVVDSQLQLPLGARLFAPQRRLLVYTAVDHPDKKAALEAVGATVIQMPSPEGKVDLSAMLRDLARQEINEVHVEAGSKLNGSLIKAGLVDEYLMYLAPALLGPGRAIAALSPLNDLSGRIELAFTSVDMVGSDLRVIARGVGRDLF